jgi:methyl-accepting chemotaxis protein
MPSTNSHVVAIQETTKNAAATIQAITKTIGEAEGISISIVQAVEQQCAATEEIARNIKLSPLMVVG